MDALISNSSKSYYACVGESTHAYQRPSKDLTAINNLLNGYTCIALIISLKYEIYLFPYLIRSCILYSQ